MAAVDEIAIKLGIKTGDLKSALADANVQIKAFGEQGRHHADGLRDSVHEVSSAMRGLHHLIAAGGIMAAVKEFFEIAIHRAEELKDSTDANVHAVKEFGEGIESVKHGFADFAVLTVGTFNRLGAAIGDTINIARSFLANGTQGFEVWAKNAETVANTAREADIAEKNLAEARKKHGAEFEAITKSLVEIEKKSQEQKLKGLDALETQANIEQHLIELLFKQAAGEGDKLEQRRRQVEIAKTQLALDEVSLTVRKEQVTEEKHLDEAAAKRVFDAIDADIEMKKRKALDQKEELEIFLLQQKNAALLTKEERDRLEVLMLQRKEKSVQIDIEDLIAKKIAEGLTPEEAKRLAELVKQNAELQKQIDAKTKLSGVIATVQKPAEESITEEMRKQKAIQDEIEAKKNALRDHGIEQKGDVKTLSDVQLDQLRMNLQAKLDDVATADRLQSGPGLIAGTFKSITQLIYQTNLDAIKREQDARRNFEETVRAFGKQAAERTFTPDEFARLGQLFNPDVQRAQATDIAGINRTLTNLFPKQAAGFQNPKS